MRIVVCMKRTASGELNPFDVKDNCELVVNIISYNVIFILY